MIVTGLCRAAAALGAAAARVVLTVRRWRTALDQALAPIIPMLAEAIMPLVTELAGVGYGLAEHYRAALQRRHTRPSAPAVNPSTTSANPSPASAIPADRRTAARKTTTSSETTTPTHRSI